ncbi:hypothetical protein GH714_041443 [Hevea brasiliensis]|uniref:Uncharacterized protein n=1 Tax=Hevea brasiliensis TaxID=3981 RepID=A0A6A6N097_HEVBR|nr:hypothetical protein GH714_041443 [Hevea brasiliensis]
MQNSVSFFEDIRRRENQMIKQALLANLAYVELELENPEKALSIAKSLLEIPECSRIYVFLGHVYAAEALCLLNKPKEAAEHLSIYLSGGINVELPFSQEDCEEWRVEKTYDCEDTNGGSTSAKISSPEESQGFVFLKPEEAQGILYANFATMHAAQGELERAHHFVTQALSLIPDSPEATLTAVYVDLMLISTPAANITASINSIPMLNGTNFKALQESVMITFEVMDLDLALRVPKPANLTDKSTSDEKREMEKWEKSNRISLMVIKRAILEAFRGTMSDQVDIAKAFLEDLEKRFAKNEKAETSTILAKLISMRGYKFYDPMTKSIFKIGNARFFEDVEFMGEKDLRTLSLKRNMSIFL